MSVRCGTTQSNEEVANLLAENKHIFKHYINETRDEIKDKLETTAEVFEVTEVDGKRVYRVKDTGTILDTSVTESISKGKPEFAKTEDNKTYSELGTLQHQAKQDIMLNLHNGIGTIKEIKRRHTTGKYRLSEEAFKAILKDTQNLYNHIVETQNKIDPDQKPYIFTEAFIVDPERSMGGTIDVLVLYSDVSASIYDYKHKSAKGNYTSNDKGDITLFADPIAFYDLNDWEAQIWEYKTILLKHYNVKEVKESRIIPNVSVIKSLPKDQQKKGHRLSTEVRAVKTQDDSTYLKPVPVAGELTGNKAVDDLSTSIRYIIESIDSSIADKSNSVRKYEVLVEKKGRLTRILRDLPALTTVKPYDSIQELQSEISVMYEEYMKKQRRLFITDKNDENYVTDEELVGLMNELAMYEQHIAGVGRAQLDAITKEGNTKDVNLKKLGTSIGVTIGHVGFLTDKVNEVALHRKADLLQEYDVQDRETAFGGLSNMFKTTSEIDHPVFEVFSKMKDKINAQTLLEEKELSEKIQDEEDKLRGWGNSRGLKGTNIYNVFLNRKTGNLHDRYTKEFWIERKKRLSEGDRKWIMEHHELAPDAQKNFNEWRKNKIDHINTFTPVIEEAYFEMYKEGDMTEQAARKKAQFVSESKGKEELQRWDSRYDVFSGKNDATAFKGKGKVFLRLKTDALNEYKTDEFKEIESNPATLRYYNFIEKFNEDMREMLGVGFSELPSNFVPEIRKSFADTFFGASGTAMKVGASFKEALSNLSVREDDTIFGIRNPKTGELEKSIPIYFMNPIRDKGNKSFHLSRSMMLFSKMAINHKGMKSIEASVMGLKATLAQAQELETTPEGEKVYKKGIGFVKKYSGVTSDLHKIFDSHVNYYLYGQGISEKGMTKTIFGKKVNSTKTLLSLKEYMSKRLMGLAFVPAAASWMAIATATRIEASKGILFNKKQWANGMKLSTRRDPKAIAMIQFFEADAEDRSALRALKASSTWASRNVTDQALFKPWRLGDRSIDDTVAVAMAQNYAFYPDGRLGRLQNVKKVNKDAKSIWDSTSLKDGKLVIEGMTEKGKVDIKKFAAFRTAVRTGARGVKGSSTRDDIKYADTALALNMMMQFKNWMPAFVRERFGSTRYDEKIDAVRMGRYEAAFSTQMDMEKGFVSFLKHDFAPALFNLSLNVSAGWFPGVKTMASEAKARKYFEKWAKQNPGVAILNTEGVSPEELAGKVTFEDFNEVMIGQTKALATELRAIAIVLASLFFLGWFDEDDDPLYKKYYYTRKLVQVLLKFENELTFLLNPNEFTRLVTSNPVPAVRLIVDVWKITGNTIDELGDLIEEDEGKDKTPFGYYSSTLFPGGIQIRRLLEVFEQDKTSPYRINR